MVSRDTMREVREAFAHLANHAPRNEREQAALVALREVINEDDRRESATIGDLAEHIRDFLHEGEDCPVCGGFYSLSTVLPVTPRQRDVIEFWIRYRQGKGISPTMDECATELGLSKTTVFGHLEALKEKGYFQGPQIRGASRGWQVLRRPPERRSPDPPEG